MRIAILCHPTSGGSGIVGTELGLALAKKGHIIHFISSEVPFRLIGSWKKNIFYHEVEDFEYPLFKHPLYDLSLMNKIYDVVTQNNLEIIHSHYAMPFAICAFYVSQMAKRYKRKVKTITTIHGTDVSIIGYESSLKDITGFALQKSDIVTSVSKAMADEAQKVYELNRKPEVIYNFVDIKPLQNPPDDLKDVFGVNNAKIITHISNFRTIKRIEDVIRIFSKIARSIDAKLLLIGDGPDQKLAYKLALRWNLLNRVHFLGLQVSIAKLLSITDIFLLPSEKENFSLSALEAMACGIPVIATDVGGMNEMITHEKNGYLAQVGEIDVMANYTISLLKDEKQYQSVSQSAKETIKKKFTPDIIIPQYEKLYQKILK